MEAFPFASLLNNIPILTNELEMTCAAQGCILSIDGLSYFGADPECPIWEHVVNPGENKQSKMNTHTHTQHSCSSKTSACIRITYVSLSIIQFLGS